MTSQKTVDDLSLDTLKDIYYAEKRFKSWKRFGQRRQD